MPTSLQAGPGPMPLVMAAAGIATWQWQPAAGRFVASDAVWALLRQPPPAQAQDAPAARQVLRWLHPDDRAPVCRALRTLQQQGQRLSLECRVALADGGLVWLACSALARRDAAGLLLQVEGILQDITERKRTEAALRASQGRLALALQAARMGVWDWPLGGCAVNFSREMFEILGLPAPGPEGGVIDFDRLRSGITDDSMDRLRAGAESALGGGGEFRVELQLAPRLGADRWIENSGRVEHDAAGQPWRLVGTVREITDRLRAEQALRESAAHHRAAFDNAALGMAENAIDGRWLNVNERLCEITGYPRAALLALDARELTHPDDRVDPWPALRRVVKGEVPFVRVEKRYRRADGSLVWVAVSSTAVRGEDGRARYFVSVIEDISARKRIEAELADHRQRLQAQVAERTRALEDALAARAESERFLRSVADNIPDMVGYWDSERVLRFANRPYRDWFAPGTDPIGRSRSALIQEEPSAPGARAFDEALAGRAQRFESVLTSPAGEVRYVWVHYIPDRQGEQVAGIFTLVSDISEVKQAELRLQALNDQLVAARDRAEAANRAKTAFLANISHEIRTPMNAIIGLTHLMQRDAVSGVASDRLDKIADAARHLLEVINDVLDLSKIESGKLKLERTDFAVDAVLARVCALVTERARAKGLELVLKSDGVPMLLRGDPTRLSQALLNLMSNAVKFTDRGSIVLRCELMEATPESLWLRFSVRDTGVGVPSDKVHDLFNAFEQADTSTTRRFGGTGLGLAITRRLAFLMGGDVGVHTVPGEGSTFWFTARLERAAQAPAGDTSGLRRRRVLVADDLPAARAALADLLHEMGMQVDSVADGDAAVQAALDAAARQQPYGLLLLDAAMPGTGGVAALKRLHALLGTAEVPPCLLVSDDDGRLGVPPELADGALGLLSKPVTLSALAAAIERLDGRSAHGTALAGPRPHELALRERVAGHRVLLAEDNPINQEVACELLRTVGVEVDVAADGQQAVRLAATEPYDLILMDMQMPVMDGLTATRRLRAMPLHARTPILAMTANAFGDDRQACLDAGMDDHLAKPVDPELLYAMLGRWLPARLVDGTPQAEPGRDAGPGPEGPTAAGPAAEAAAPAAERQAPMPQQAPVSTPAPAALASAPMPLPSAAAGAVPAPVSGVSGAPPDLAGIPGLVMARALLYLPGRDQVFARVLRQFLATYGDGVPGLELALDRSDWAAAGRLLHALRGACGAVGAVAVLELCRQIEQQLRAFDDAGAMPSAEAVARVRSQGTMLQEMLAELLAHVRARLQPLPAPHQ